MLAQVISRKFLILYEEFCHITVAMKKQTNIKIKETSSLLHANINLHLISWLDNNPSDDLNS